MLVPHRCGPVTTTTTTTLIVTLAPLLLLLNCAGSPVRAGKCEEEQRQQLELSKGQSAKLQILWASTHKNLSLDFVQENVMTKLDEALQGKEVSISKLSIRKASDEFVSTYLTNLTLVSKDKPAQLNQLSPQLLLALHRIVDCQQVCTEVKGSSEYLLQPEESFSGGRSALFVLDRITVSLEIDLIDPSESNRNEGNCKICQDILTNREEAERSTMGVFVQHAQNFLIIAFNLLDPNRWLILLVSIWLTACFIIAMLIKKRDKRRLRLYLEERTDYSFSTNRRN